MLFLRLFRVSAMCLTFAVMAVGCHREQASDTHVQMAASHALTLKPERLELHRPTDGNSQTVTCRITNQNDFPVEITSIDGTCACSMAEPPLKTMLAHGEFVDVTIQVQFPSFGTQVSTLTIATKPEMAIARVPIRLVSPAESIPRLLLFPRQVQLIRDGVEKKYVATAFLTTLERGSAGPWLVRAVVEGQTTTVKLQLVDAEPQTRKTEKTRSDAIVRREYKLTFQSPDDGGAAFSSRLLLYDAHSAQPITWDSYQSLVSFMPNASLFQLRPSIVVQTERPTRDTVTRVAILGPAESRIELDTAELPIGVKVDVVPVAAGEGALSQQLEIRFDEIDADSSFGVVRLKCIAGAVEEIHALRIRRAW